MNDEILEQQLREFPAPELPVTWRAEILATVLREVREPARSRQAWPPLLVCLRNLFARNPMTATAMTLLWMLIFIFKASTPIDPSESRLVAHFDPHRPVYGISISNEILLAQLAQDEPEQRQLRQIP